MSEGARPNVQRLRQGRTRFSLRRKTWILWLLVVIVIRRSLLRLYVFVDSVLWRPTIKDEMLIGLVADLIVACLILRVINLRLLRISKLANLARIIELWQITTAAELLTTLEDVGSARDVVMLARLAPLVARYLALKMSSLVLWQKFCQEKERNLRVL